MLDHAKKPAEKVRISGGGRCNFTNLETEPKCFLSENPHFAKSALARYTPWDFCSLMAEHDLTWTEKTLGQLFCEQKSGAVIEMLLDELAGAGGRLELETAVHEVRREADRFVANTTIGEITSESLIIATGGLSIPKMGATGFAYEVAEQFGHEVIAQRPALVRSLLPMSIKRPSLTYLASPFRLRRAQNKGRALSRTCSSPIAAYRVHLYCRSRLTGSKARPSRLTFWRVGMRSPAFKRPKQMRRDNRFRYFWLSSFPAASLTISRPR